MQKQWSVYAIKNMDGQVFYVGISTNIKRRMKEHKTRWGYRPEYIILETGTTPFDPYHSKEEHKWIEQYRKMGISLLNKTEAGDGIQVAGANTRKLISEGGKGRPVTEETRKKRSEYSKGKSRNWTIDGEKRVRETQFKKGHIPHCAGKHLPDEVKKKISIKISAGLIGNKRRLGIPHTEETKKHLAEVSRNLECNSPDKMAKKAKSFWASLSQKERKEFIRKREEKRQIKLKIGAFA